MQQVIEDKIELKIEKVIHCGKKKKKSIKKNNNVHMFHLGKRFLIKPGAGTNLNATLEVPTCSEQVVFIHVRLSNV